MAATPAAKPAAKPAGKAKAKANNTKGRMYEVSSDGKAVKKSQTCPRCGDGVFLASHKDRVSCGKCGYTEYKK